MTRWHTTKSGYRYEVIPVQEVEAVAEGDHFVWTCTCGLPVQGGRRALVEHRKTVHKEEA